jgi:hypothetical protein
MVCSIVGYALDSIALSALNDKVCAQSHVIAPISHSTGKLVMAARATRKTWEYVACARLWFLGSSTEALERIGVRSIVVALDCSSCVIKCTARDMTPSLLNFTPLNHILNQGPTAH